jgi:DNA polymerase III delta subunit
LKQFKTIGLFGEKELIAILENKCEELIENNEDLKKKYKELNKCYEELVKDLNERFHELVDEYLLKK